MAAEDIIRQANQAYYEGDPIMSDAEYDALEKELVGEPDQVAGGYIPTSRKRTHRIPMLSLAKVHNHEDLHSWLGKIAEQLDDPSATVSVEPKWDGGPVEAVYLDGQLQSAVTRGNGVVGEDVTATASVIPAIRDGAVLKQGEEIRFLEVLLEKDRLDQINQRFGTEYKNTRNTATGTIRREDDLGLQIAAYLTAEDHGVPTHSTVHRLDQTEAISDRIRSILEGRDSMPVDIDGAVVKIQDIHHQEELGVTSHSPRWAVAFKFPPRGAETTLESVYWTVGKTGKITPVGQVSPIQVGGVTITTVTLHNQDFINSHELRIGDRVLVERAGDVIPYLSSVVQHNGGELVVQPDDLDMEESKLAAAVYAVSCLTDADGLGPALVTKLHLNGKLDVSSVTASLSSLLSLKEGDISSMEGYGESSEANALAAISRMSEYGPVSWLAALSIPGLGWTLSDQLIQRFTTLEGLVQASYEDLVQMEGFGPIRASAILDAIQTRVIPLVQMLQDRNIDLPLPEVQEIQADPFFLDKTVVITGNLSAINMTRDELADILIGRGAKMGGSVSSRTDLLIVGAKAGSKLAKAEQLGVAVITAEEVADRIKD